MPARDFTSASTYMQYGDVSFLNSQAQLSFSLWCEFNAVSADHALIEKGSSTADALIIWRDNSGTGGVANMLGFFIEGSDLNSHRCQGPDESFTATGTWYHAAGIFDGTNDAMIAYGDGVAGVTATGLPATTGSNVGGSQNFLIGGPTIKTADGSIAYPCFWNTRLTASEISALAAGCSPLRIRPNNIVFFAPIGLVDDNMFGTETAILNGSPPVVTGPPVEHPFRSVSRTLVAFPAGTGATYVEVPTGGSTCAATGTCTATLDVIRSITATAAATGSATATLGRVRTLTATAASTGTATAQLNRLASITATAAAVGASTASVGRIRTLTATCAATGSATAVLESVSAAVKEITATCAAVGAATAQLNRLASISATAASTGTATASVGRIRTLTATCAAVGTSTATLESVGANIKLISATCAAVGAATATLNRLASLTPTAAATGTATAQLNRLASLTATAPAVATLTAQLNRLASLAATAAATGSATATLGTQPVVEITATCAASGTCSATLEILSDFVSDVRRNFSSGSRSAFSSSAGRTFSSSSPV